MDREDAEYIEHFRRFKSACPEYYDFCQKVYQNRFFGDLTHPVFAALKYAKDNRTEILFQGTSVYRARRMPHGLKWEKQPGFDVLNEIEIGAPPSCPEGRANPAHTSRLYVSDSQYCALSEVRPACGESVAIGVGYAIQDLKLLSFTNWPSLSPCSEKSIVDVLDRAFSTPITDVKDYLPTQVIAEYVRIHLQMDGISFSSSQCPGGINYLLFDPAKIKFTAAKQFTTRIVSYVADHYCPEYECLTPQKRDVTL